MPVFKLIILAFTDGLGGSFRRLFNSSIKRRFTDKNLREKKSFLIKQKEGIV